jgi:hypothetical protein
VNVQKLEETFGVEQCSKIGNQPVHALVIMVAFILLVNLVMSRLSI